MTWAKQSAMQYTMAYEKLRMRQIANHVEWFYASQLPWFTAAAIFLCKGFPGIKRLVIPHDVITGTGQFMRNRFYGH